MECFLYFLIALVATSVGVLTGMGGGVIIKPVLDAFSGCNVATINLLSSATVFAMALVSVLRQIQQRAVFDTKIAVPLAIGSLLGGNAGQQVLERTAVALHADHMVVAAQNICLAFLIIVAFLYMSNGKRIVLNLRGIIPTLLTGILMGTVSSFLGIGGGPINVALIIFVFACDMKAATLYSIITILFSQASKLASMALSGSLFQYDLSMLPPLITGAVLGGMAGSYLNKRLAEKAVEKVFGAVQLLVFLICLINIFHSLKP